MQTSHTLPMDTIRMLLEMAKLPENKGGFTHFLSEKERRYIIGFTHNEGEEQVINSALSLPLAKYQDLTFGGWTDEKTGIQYLDFGIASDDLDFSLKLGKTFGQLAIWDNLEMKEIRLDEVSQ